MFVIDNNIPYQVIGDTAYRVSFGDNGQVKINSDESFKVIEPIHHYTYDEVIRKFNVKYLIAVKKKEYEDNKEIAILKNENEKLQKKIEELSKPKAAEKASAKTVADKKVEAKTVEKNK